MTGNTNPSVRIEAIYRPRCYIMTTSLDLKIFVTGIVGERDNVMGGQKVSENQDFEPKFAPE